jgi:hypothetical protein
MERLPRIVLALPPQNSAPAGGFFVPSFWDKTWDKTLLFPHQKMAENLVFFDRLKEPRDQIHLSVPSAYQTSLAITPFYAREQKGFCP